jgi:hypothetical protein
MDHILKNLEVRASSNVGVSLVLSINFFGLIILDQFLSTFCSAKFYFTID